MSRLTKLTKDQVSDDLREQYRSLGEKRGNVPNMFRVFSHRPEIVRTMWAHLDAVTNSGTVPARTKELVATLVSRMNVCAY
ncbi:MAG TPA: hypothetical protein VM779_10490 [Thermoanaerobaculia bacterium]|nr:hypothetical protein [Thermoanaerobaculia bacterium]